LLFSAGGVRLALRVSHLREVVAVDAGGAPLVRGEPLPAAFVASVLGLPAGPSPFAILTEGATPAALRVEALHGIVDLAEAEFFQLPARTLLPQPVPFAGAFVHRDEIVLELAVASLGFAPIEPAVEHGEPPAEIDPPQERELRFARGARTFGVPLSLLVQVLESPRVAPVPLAPPSHLGLLYQGRSLHPVLDVAVLYGDAPAPARRVLLLDAGGSGVAVAADRVLGVGEPTEPLVRPPWDTVFGT
jgi:chemotaxis signal transduction protein